MAFARGQTTGKIRASNAVSASGTMGGAVTAGSLIIAPVVGYAGCAWRYGDVTDDLSNDYLLACVVPVQTYDNGSVAIFYAENVAAGTPTITINPQSAPNNYFTGCATEFTGFGGEIRLLDRFVTITNGSSTTTPAVGPTADLYESDAVVVAVFGMFNNQASITVETVSPAWTEEFEELSFSYMPGEGVSRIVSAGGAQSCSWVAGTGGIYGVALAAFSLPGAAPPSGGGGAWTFVG